MFGQSSGLDETLAGHQAGHDHRFNVLGATCRKAVNIMGYRGWRNRTPKHELTSLVSHAGDRIEGKSDRAGKIQCLENLFISSKSEKAWLANQGQKCVSKI
jgi:hypothetical protein